MKRILTALTFLSISILLNAQTPINVDKVNPYLTKQSVIRLAMIDDSGIYLGGYIARTNDEISPPLVKLSFDGAIDESYQSTLKYSNQLSNSFVGSTALVNGDIFIQDDATRSIRVIESDGTEDISKAILKDRYARSFTGYRDSLLVSIGWPVQLYLMDKFENSREIDVNSTEEYYFESVIKISDNLLFFAYFDTQESKYNLHLIRDNFVADSTFTPIKVNYYGNIRNIKLLPTGELFIAGGGLELNGIEGNGLFILNSDGSISEKSFHDADMSFIDPRGYGTEYALPLDNGNFFIVGRSAYPDHHQWMLGRLLPSGQRDDSFITKYFTIDDNYGSFFMLKKNNAVYLIGSQYEYDGKKSGGINKIDLNGNDDNSFSISFSGIGRAKQLQKYAPDKYLLTGSFKESVNSNTSHISFFSPDTTASFAWSGTLDYQPDDLFGAAKVLSNGDLLVGLYDRDGDKLIRVYGQDGLEKNFSTDVYANYVESSVYDIHEINDNIIVTGRFYYYHMGAYKYNMIKMNSSYEIDAAFDNTQEITDSDIIYFSYVDKSERILVQKVSSDYETSSIVRLNPDGSKDSSFKDITIERISGFSRNQTHVFRDSLIMIFPYDFNNTQFVKLYDFDGNLLNEELFSMGRHGEVIDVIPLSDTTMILTGSFSQVNNIPRSDLALVSLKGAIYDDLSLDIEDRVSHAKLVSDTLFLLGPGAIEGKNQCGFFAYKLDTPPVKIESIEVTTEANVQLNWEEDLRIRQIDIYRKSSAEAEVLIGTVQKGINSFIDDSSEPNIDYTYRLVSKNIFGEKSMSIEFKIDKPEAPSELSANYQNESVQLSWKDNSSTEVGFQIYQSNEGSDFTLIGETEMDITTFKDTIAILDHVYSYFVIAKSFNFMSNPSDTIKLDMSYPESATGLSYNCDNPSKQATILWENPNSNATEIIIYETDENEALLSIDTINSSHIEYTIQIVEMGEVTNFYLMYGNEYGYSESSDTLAVSCVVLGIEDIQDKLSVYPNPARAEIGVNIYGNNIGQVTIADLSGKIVRSVDVIKNAHISTDALPAGTYILNIYSETECVRSQLLVVQ